MNRALALAAAVLAVASVSYAQVNKAFATERLEKIAEAVGLSIGSAKATEIAIPASASHAAAYARVDADGIVSHIGYPIFRREEMPYVRPEIIDFIERTALEQSLFASGTMAYAHWEFPGDVEFVNGDWPSLTSITRADNVVVGYANADNKQCQITVNKDGEEVCALCFPIDYPLISGAAMAENEQRLVSAIQNANGANAPQAPHGPIEFSSEHGCYVAIGEPLKGSVLKYMLFYKPVEKEAAPEAECETMGIYTADGEIIEDADTETEDVQDAEAPLHLIYEPLLPVESISNLLSTTDIDADLMANVTINTTDGKKTATLPLLNLTALFLNSGCTPYFGVYDFDRADNRISVAMKMYNPDLGYMHLLKVDAKISNLFVGEPGAERSVDVEIHPFIAPSGSEPQQIIDED